MNNSSTEQRLLRLAERSTISLIPYESRFRDAALQIAREIHAKSIYAAMKLDEDRLIDQIKTGHSGDRYFKFAVRGDEVLGAFGGFVCTPMFSRQMIAADRGFFVKETARGGAAAVCLLADFESWAKAAGAVLMVIGQSTGIDIARTTKLYHHCGLKVVGVNSVKEL